jgi:hypothetical protein
MAKRKRTKGQTAINKTYTKKLQEIKLTQSFLQNVDMDSEKDNLYCY